MLNILSKLGGLRKATPIAVATTFVVGGSVAVVETYTPGLSQYVDVQGAASAAVGAAAGVIGTVLFGKRSKK